MRTFQIDVANKAGSVQFRSGCPAVLGSAPSEPGAACHVIRGDRYVSRKQLLIEEADRGRIRLENRSTRVPLTLHDGTVIPPGDARVVEIPARVVVGETRIDIAAVAEGESATGATLVPLDDGLDPGSSLADLGPAPDPARLASWLGRVVGLLQQASASDDAFHEGAARAVVGLVGLDRGLVLAREGQGWAVEARYPDDGSDDDYSRAVLAEVLRTGKPVYDAGRVAGPSASLRDLGAVVAAPWVDPRDGRVAGVVYGSRARTASASAVTPLEAQVVRVLASAVGAGRARKAWQDRFARFTAPELARHLDRDPSALDVGERVVTLLSADVRGSSTLAARLGPRYFDLSRDLMGRLTSRIAERAGLVVDYAGDGILAMWNAPEPAEDHADRACRAALAMLGELEGLNATWAAELGGPVALGIGVHTGPALVGNAGSRWKVKYGPIGDAANTASRVEGATKHLGVPILLSESTRSALRDRLPTRRLCRARLAGLGAPLALHELYAGAADEEWEAHRAAYEAALKQYEAGAFAQAGRRLQHHLGQWADAGARPDPPALALLSRVVACLQRPPGEGFLPDWDLTIK